MASLLSGGHLHDRVSSIYFSAGDAIQRRMSLKNNKEEVKDSEDNWPSSLKALEWLYILSWVLSWLAAFSAMEHARKISSGTHNSELEELDTLTPLFIACQKSCRFPQKLFEAVEASRVHGPVHKRFRKRLAYLASTAIKLVLWSAAAFYTGLYWEILIVFYVIGIFASYAVVTQTEKDENWPGFNQMVKKEIRSIADEFMSSTRTSLQY